VITGVSVVPGTGGTQLMVTASTGNGPRAGTLALKVLAGGVRDIAGNALAADVTGAATFTVDTMPPVVSAVSASPAAISPNGDSVQDETTIHFTLSED